MIIRLSSLSDQAPTSNSLWTVGSRAIPFDNSSGPSRECHWICADGRLFQLVRSGMLDSQRSFFAEVDDCADAGLGSGVDIQNFGANHNLLDDCPRGTNLRAIRSSQEIHPGKGCRNLAHPFAEQSCQVCVVCFSFLSTQSAWVLTGAFR